MSPAPCVFNLGVSRVAPAARVHRSSVAAQWLQPRPGLARVSRFGPGLVLHRFTRPPYEAESGFSVVVRPPVRSRQTEDLPSKADAGLEPSGQWRGSAGQSGLRVPTWAALTRATPVVSGIGSTQSRTSTASTSARMRYAGATSLKRGCRAYIKKVDVELEKEREKLKEAMYRGSPNV